MVTSVINVTPPTPTVPCEIFAITSQESKDTLTFNASYQDPVGSNFSIPMEEIILTNSSRMIVPINVTPLGNGRSCVTTISKVNGPHSLSIVRDGRDIATLVASSDSAATSKLVYLNQLSNIYCDISVNASRIGSPGTINFRLLDARMTEYTDSSKPNLKLSVAGPDGPVPLMSQSSVSSFFHPTSAGLYTISFFVGSASLPILNVTILPDLEAGKAEVAKEFSITDVKGVIVPPSACFTFHPISIPFRVIDLNSGSDVTSLDNISMRIVCRETGVTSEGVVECGKRSDMRCVFTVSDVGEHEISLFYSEKALSSVTLDVFDLSLSLIGSIQSSPIGYVGRSHRVTCVLTNTLTNEQVRSHIHSLKHVYTHTHKWTHTDTLTIPCALTC